MAEHTILIVEDEVLIRMAISEFLQEHGFKTLEASIGAEGIAILQATVVDLVVTDVRMDGRLDGVALANWVRVNKPDVPVIFVSGNPPTDVLYELGEGYRVLSKPIDYEAMVTLIRSLLRGSG